MPKHTTKQDSIAQETTSINIRLSKVLLGACALQMYGKNPTTKKQTDVIRDIVLNYAIKNVDRQIRDAIENRPDLLKYYYEKLTTKMAFNLQDISSVEDLPEPIGDRVE